MMEGVRLPKASKAVGATIVPAPTATAGYEERMARPPVANPDSAPIAPFVYRRWVRWADTDPAAIAYTARLPEMCMEALEAWFRERLGFGWYELNRDLGLGTPFVHLSVDFRGAVTPRDELALRVLLRRTGGSSLHFTVTATRVAEPTQIAFEGQFVCAFVRAGVMKAIPIPERFRDVLAREVAIAESAAPADAAPAGRSRRRVQSA